MSVVYLSGAQNPIPSFTHCMYTCIQYTYSHRILLLREFYIKLCKVADPDPEPTFNFEVDCVPYFLFQIFHEKID
jgi:hypothetical protein